MRALLIDDERLARTEMRRLLAAHPQIEIVGEAANADEAEQRIAEWNPDVLFLDVQMPAATGFDLLERLDRAPRVIFVTAYDEFALKAFEVSALDYLVKPVSPERLAFAIEKLLSRQPSPQLSASTRVFVRDGDRCWFVAIEDIVLLESEGNYTRLYFGAERPLVLRSLNHMESRLDPALFFRASRRHLLNMRFIEAIDPWVTGGLQVKMKGGMLVEMSRRQAQRFRETMSL